MNVREVFEFYQEFVKPIYSEIEARWNDIPVELLFETYAAFDHIKRGVLDAFKLKLKYFNQDIKKFLESKVDFQLIDNGKFISSFYRDKQEIILIAKNARLIESQSSKENAF